MSKLDELIEKLCPNGVEYKELGNITSSINIGINPRKFFKLNPQNADGFYVTVRELNGLNGVKKYEKTDLIDENAVRIINERANIERDDILFSNTGTVGKMALVLEKPEKWGVNEGIYVIKPIQKVVNSKYLYYYLDSNMAFSEYSKKFTGSTLKHVTQKALQSIKIPVPPLEVQCEIVRILDDFTLLSAELSAELKARKKQYEYYRDEVFKFENSNDVEYVKLGKVATISRGGNFQKKDFIEFGFPCIHYGQIYTKYRLYADKTYTFISNEVANKSKIATPNDVIMAVTSENVEDVCKCVAWIGNENTAVSGHTAIIHSEINAKYLSYYFHTSMFYNQKLKYVHGTKVMEFTPSNLENIEIPIVSKEKQEKIVSLLDRFDSLCNDISKGLPAEIEARQKQYEYYRDKLLTFKELKV